MDDLVKLNLRIAAHWLGTLDAEQESYLSFASVCCGELIPSAQELKVHLAVERQRQHNSLSIATLNRHYLRFARLAAKDISAGKMEMLIRLGITLEQAELLANLTDDAMNRLAFGRDGPIIQFAREAFMRGLALHHRAAKYHAIAFVATALARSLRA